MAKSRRSYKGAAVSNTLGATLSTSTATSINLAADMSGWPTGTNPFFVVIEPGTAKEEKVCVVYTSAKILTVVDPAVTSGWTASANGRGADDTTARAHDSGAVVYPVFTATEADQANELVSKYTTNGDIVVHGTTAVKTISTGGSGGNNKVLVADSTVTDGGVKWSTIVDANVNASAAIALSKLATGALPTAITVASANLVDGTIVAGDLASDAVTTAKIADAAVTSPKLAAPTLVTKATSSTLVITDANCTLLCGSGITLTVPTSAVAFPNGTVVTVVNYGGGTVTISQGSVTVNSSNGKKLRTQYSVATLVKISDTEWVLTGDTVA